MTDITPSQCACLALTSQGLRSKEVARVLGLSPRGVDEHLLAAARRFGLHSRWQAANAARDQENRPCQSCKITGLSKETGRCSLWSCFSKGGHTMKTLSNQELTAVSGGMFIPSQNVHSLPAFVDVFEDPSVTGNPTVCPPPPSVETDGPCPPYPGEDHV